MKLAEYMFCIIIAYNGGVYINIKYVSFWLFETCILLSLHSLLIFVLF